MNFLQSVRRASTEETWCAFALQSLRNAKGVKGTGGKGGIRTWEGDGLGAEVSSDTI